MAKIKIMSDDLANKIAAGEVVERPSSVVKELIENSIDAMSTKIDIYLEDSGIASIKVIDNGHGMDEEDAYLAFSRHATSKLLSEQDLFRIHSLGFRGEALPSIASVSDVTLITSTGDKTGVLIHNRGGKLLKKEASHQRKGTEITVKNLFYNTPARLKYLKSTNTELSYTIDYINKLAISHPQIAFKLVNNNHVLLQTNGNNNIVNVLSSIYGLEVAKNIQYVEYNDSTVNVNLYFTTPEINRTTRSYITVVVNERIIKNYEIIKSVIEGYESYLPINRYPIVVLQINVDPLLVDVNVHPAKLEVRLSNQEHIKTVIVSLIRGKLRDLMYVPKVTIKQVPTIQNEFVQESLDFIQKEESKDIIENEISHEIKENDQPYVSNVKAYEVPNKEPIILKENEELRENKQIVQASVKRKIPKMFYIGQLAGTYLLAQNEEGLFLIDQHAAQERINYEYYLKHFSKVRHEFYELLIPLTFEFSLNESLIIEEQLDVIKSMNIDIEKFGLSSYMVTKVPNFFNIGNEKEILNTIFEFIFKNKKINNATLFNELAITLSCKRSIKANHYINELEIKQLLDDLERTENPYTCPHGRPVIISMTLNEIEHLFKRSM